jgi:hypothetical protein
MSSQAIELFVLSHSIEDNASSILETNRIQDKIETWLTRRLINVENKMQVESRQR